MSNFQMTNMPDTPVHNASSLNGPNNIMIGSTSQNIPPALPPRPQIQRYGVWPNTNSYGSGYSNYGYTGYNGYGSYGSYGSYGGYGPGYGTGYSGMFGGYNRPGLYGHNNLESRFIQYAEENTRPAFQSIESVVSAFGGIASMLDSTFLAMTTTFRAILGVAENFGRLRSLFAQFWSTFALFKTLNWIYRKILSILGLSRYNSKKFEAWAEAVNGIQNPENKKPSNWPIVMFLGIITAAPYIIYKLFGGLTQSISEKASDPSTWEKPLLASALYDLSSHTPGELSLRSMQSVKVAPLEIQNQMNLMNTGWLLASTDNKTSGLVPANYIRIIKGNINYTANNINNQKLPTDLEDTAKKPES